MPVSRGQDGARAGLVRSGDAQDFAERSVVPAPVPSLAAQFIEHSGVHALPDELGYDDDLDADRIVGATGSRVPGSKGCRVLEPPSTSGEENRCERTSSGTATLVSTATVTYGRRR
jgi:hypothetical protein